MTRIDKGLMPDPPPLRKTKYPWLSLEIGDSFEIDTSLSAAKVHAAKAGDRYRRTFEAGMSRGKVRIWRWK
jgi:hypothetical protein